MPATQYLNQLKVAKGMLPSDDPLAEILKELLALEATGRLTFNMTTGSANCICLYKNDLPWGALINFKAGNIPSFVHELTHASCSDSFKADFVNYKPKKINNVAYVFTKASIPKAPVDTRACMNEVPRRAAWYDEDSEAFLSLNLTNLEAWVKVTDFSTPRPWLDPKTTKEIEALKKLIASGRGTQENLNKLADLQTDNQSYGVLISTKKKSQQQQLLETEKQRKRAYIIERIGYARVGQSGMGDVHFEYDTVVNQMLYQMYMWGFRPPKQINPPLLMLSEQTKSKTVPAQYLYGLIEKMAKDAFDRRKEAKQIAAGSAPAVHAPMRVINPPKI